MISDAARTVSVNPSRQTVGNFLSTVPDVTAPFVPGAFRIPNLTTVETEEQDLLKARAQAQTAASQLLGGS